MSGYFWATPSGKKIFFSSKFPDKVSGTKLYKIELNKISKEILKTQCLNYNLSIEEVKLIYSAQEYLKLFRIASAINSNFTLDKLVHLSEVHL
jgi:hypothetical protein